jgi:hypothetical protein
MIIFGSGGGFTGMAAGYIIHGNGKIEKWSGLYFRRDKLEALGTAQPEALQPLRQMFETKSFFAMVSSRSRQYDDAGVVHQRQ